MKEAMKKGFRIALLIAVPVAAVSANYACNAMWLDGVSQWRIVVKASLLSAICVIAIAQIAEMIKAMKAGLPFWRQAIPLAVTGLLICAVKIYFAL